MYVDISEKLTFSDRSFSRSEYKKVVRWVREVFLKKSLVDGIEKFWESCYSCSICFTYDLQNDFIFDFYQLARDDWYILFSVLLFSNIFIAILLIQPNLKKKAKFVFLLVGAAIIFLCYFGKIFKFLVSFFLYLLFSN